jgi:GNAT superfamily N-acetyltransferase
VFNDMLTDAYHFKVCHDEVKPWEASQITCFNQDNQEIGRLQFTGLEYDYCVRIEDLYVKPDCRRQGVGSAMLNYLIKRNPAVPIFVNIVPVYRGVDLNGLIEFYTVNGFYVKRTSNIQAEGYFNFGD